MSWPVKKVIFKCVVVFSMFIAFSSLAQSRMVLVDKPKLRLYVIDQMDTILSLPICAGINYGDKMYEGDNRTPEGTFTISQIQNSSAWKHDFGDGNGETRGAYGPWFFRLKTPMWTGIGIHGTCFPESIGKRESEGCVRLKNEDLIKLKSLIKVGIKVVIIKDEL